MKNTIYLDSDFNFLLLENEEEDTGLTQNKIYINIPTSAAANQALDISVAGGAPITVSIPSSAKVNFELSQQYWADNGDVEITPKNDDITGDTITIHFPESFMVSAALNYLFDDEFEIVAQNENFAEGGSSSGSGSGGGSAFDFVETIRNIGFRLLDEPSNVNAYFDEIAEEVQIKWTDPADISTNEPAPAEWAGTVVVRKEGSAPLHRWDGDLIVDSTTRDQYASNALVDNTLDISKNYYYGIFPYDTKGDYRFTKVVAISSQPIPAPEIVDLAAGITNITVNYSVADRYTYDYITLVYKKNSAPADKTDGTAVSLSASDTNIDITGLDDETTYYFKIFAKVTGQSEEMTSDAVSATTDPYTVITYDIMERLRLLDFSTAVYYSMFDTMTYSDINSNANLINDIKANKVICIYNYNRISSDQFNFGYADGIITLHCDNSDDLTGGARLILPFGEISKIVEIAEKIKFASGTTDYYVGWAYMSGDTFTATASSQTGDTSFDWTEHKDTFNPVDNKKAAYIVLTLYTNPGHAADLKVKDLFIKAREE